MTGDLTVVFPGRNKTRTQRERRSVVVMFDAEFMAAYREACRSDPPPKRVRRGSRWSVS